MSEYIFVPEVLQRTDPIDGTINSIKKLSRKFDIYIITARTEEMISSVKKWLKKYNINKNIKEVISSSFEKKQDICLKNNISFLCDDDLRHIIDKKIKYRVLFGKKRINNNTSYSVLTSWHEIENFILFKQELLT